MAINEQHRMDFIGNGATAEYPYTFKIFSPTDLTAIIRDLNDFEEELAYPADFDVTGVGRSAGGTILLRDGNLPVGYHLTILRVRPLDQLTVIRNQTAFFPEVHEDTFDTCRMIDQQLADGLERSVRLGPTVTGVDTTLPPPKANNIIVWNGDADGLTNLPVADGLPSGSQSIAGDVNLSGDLNVGTDAEITGDLVVNGTIEGDVSFRQAGVGAIDRTVEDKLREQFSVSDFGAVGDGVTDDTVAIQTTIDRAPVGSRITLVNGKTYKTSAAILLNKSHLIFDMNFAEILFQPVPAAPHLQDRAMVVFTQPDPGATPPRTVTSAIAIGATSFTTSGATGDLTPGMWIIVYILEPNMLPAPDVVVIDWAQVASVAGTTVNIVSPFRTAFPLDARGTQFIPVPNVVEDVTVCNGRIRSTDTTQALPSFTASYVRDVRFLNVESNPARGNAFYSYRCQGVTISASRIVRNTGQSSELAESVDVVVDGNTFGTFDVPAETPCLTIDMGTGFFVVSNNIMQTAASIGMQMYNGVHDGVVSGNVIGFVSNSGIGNALGMIGLGVQRIAVRHNVLTGGAGALSTGIQFGDTSGFIVNLHSEGSLIGPNIIHGFVQQVAPPVSLTPDDIYQIATDAHKLRLASGVALGEDPLIYMDTLLHIKSITDALLAIHYERTGAGNYYTGFETSPVTRYYFGYNLPAVRDAWLDHLGNFVLANAAAQLWIKNTASSGGLKIGNAGTNIFAYLTGERLAVAAADYSANPIPAQGQATFTVTVTDAAQFDELVTATPKVNPGPGLVWNAYVSGTNTVTVIVSNITAAPIAPATTDWWVTVTRHS